MPMQLINLDHSPYAARIRIQIRKKNLPIEVIPPPVALKSDEFKQRFTLGKVPVLLLEDGGYLPESVAIMEYLEDSFPTQALRPKSALAAARSRVMVSYADTHLGPALFPLFRLLLGVDPNVDAAKQAAAMRVEFDKLDRWLQQDTPLEQRALHLGDIALIPTLWYCTALLPIVQQPNVWEEFPQVVAWWRWVNTDPAVVATLEEMTTAFNAFAASLKK